MVIKLCLTPGRSSEGRDIKVVEVGRGSRKIWIDGGIHAR